MSRDTKHYFWLLLVIVGISSISRGGPDFDPEQVGWFLLVAACAILGLFLIQLALQGAWLSWRATEAVVFTRQVKNAWHGAITTAAITFLGGFLGYLLYFLGSLFVGLVTLPFGGQMAKAAEIKETAWLIAYIAGGVGFLVGTVMAYSTTDPDEWERRTYTPMHG